MTDTKHAPTPWVANTDTTDKRQWGYIRGKDDLCPGTLAIAQVMRCHKHALGNAALIVRAVNGHEEAAKLLAECDELLAEINEGGAWLPGKSNHPWPVAARKLRKAIAKAEPKT